MEAKFKKIVWQYYSRNKRDLPWRKTSNPYKILVSEVMLQQTQVDRVIPKYQEFLKAFPSPRILSQASLRDVLRVWNGLGYNRRAQYLKQTAEIIVNEFGSKLPQSIDQLQALPGIGYHTAGAIAAFAFNQPVVFIETNIRSVYIHHFFKNVEQVSDRQLLPLIEQTLDRSNPREWYWALMDYGAYLKKQIPNPSRASNHHLVQTRFEGSNRQLRGQVIRQLLVQDLTKEKLYRTLSFKKASIDQVLAQLANEGLVNDHRNSIRLSNK